MPHPNNPLQKRPRFEHAVQLTHEDFRLLNNMMTEVDDLTEAEQRLHDKVKHIYGLMLNAHARKQDEHAKRS